MKVNIRHTVDLLVTGGTVRGVELALQAGKEGRSVFIATSYSYFGDDVCAELNLRNIPDFLKQQGVPEMPTLMQVKRTLDRLVIQNDIPFAFQTAVLGRVKDCVIFADRDSIYAVRAREIADVTPLHTLTRSVKKLENTAAVYRALVLCREEEADYKCGERFLRLHEEKTQTDLTLEPEHYFRTVLELRSRFWRNEHIQAADRIAFPELEKEPELFVPEASAGETVDYKPEQEYICDIAVAGGGTAGAGAAVPGAKNGLKTLVLERLSHLGGTGTQGRIASYWYGLRIGYTKALDQAVEKRTPELPGLSGWNAASKEYVREKENLESGASVWLESSSCGADTENGKITGILAATPFGGVKIKAEQFIDCTGNAELAYMADAPTEFADPLEPAHQGSGMCPNIPGYSYTNTDYMFTVDSDTKDVMRAFITGRDRLGDRFDLSQLPGTRERRRIIGEVVLRASDFYSCRSYPDTVALASSNFDTHGFTVDPLLLYHPTDHQPFIAEIPLRALLSPGISNLMTTGLGISAQRDAMPLIRMIADVQNQGYIAGLLAAEAVKNKKELRELNLASVQKTLKAEGFLTPDQEIPESGLNRDAEIFSDPDIPALERDYQKEPDFEKGLRLAFLGSSAGKDLLRETVQENTWDEGWNYTGMGQFGRSGSRLDAAVIALRGICGDASFLLPRLKEMTPETEFSHFRAVCLFLMKHPCKAAAEELHRLLACFECHAVSDWKQLLDSPVTDPCDVTERNFQLRELYLAGALSKCDPADGLAADFLEKYRSGLHKLYAIYAEKWQ